MYPRVHEVLVSGSQLRLTIEPIEIKKNLFMLVSHQILKLHYDEDDKVVVFQLAKSKYNNTLLAMQCKTVGNHCIVLLIIVIKFTNYYYLIKSVK